MPAKIHTFFLGVYYGFLLILFIYNAAFFFGIHDRTNIFFAGYVISIGLFQVCADGFATQLQELLFGGFFVEGIVPRFILGNAACGLAALFTREYLLLKTYSLHAHRWLGFLAALSFGLAAIIPVAATPTIARLSNYLMALSALPVLLSAIGPLRQGYRPALCRRRQYVYGDTALLPQPKRTHIACPAGCGWQSSPRRNCPS